MSDDTKAGSPCRNGHPCAYKKVLEREWRERNDMVYEVKTENERLRAWLRYIAVDDSRAQQALAGDCAPNVND